LPGFRENRVYNFGHWRVFLKTPMMPSGSFTKLSGSLAFVLKTPMRVPAVHRKGHGSFKERHEAWCVFLKTPWGRKQYTVTGVFNTFHEVLHGGGLESLNSYFRGTLMYVRYGFLFLILTRHKFTVRVCVTFAVQNNVSNIILRWIFCICSFHHLSSKTTSSTVISFSSITSVFIWTNYGTRAYSTVQKPLTTVYSITITISCKDPLVGRVFHGSCTSIIFACLCLCFSCLCKKYTNIVGLKKYCGEVSIYVE